MNTLKKILYLLSQKEKKQLGVLLVMALGMSIIDMIGVASIVPFVAVLTNPSLIETNVILKNLFQISNKFGIENSQEFVFVLGVAVFILLIFSLTFKALTTYLQLIFINMREYSIGKRLIENYVQQPFSWFLNQHSAELGKTILSEVSLVIENGLNPLIKIITQSFIVIALIILLILNDPKLAFIISLTLILSYVLTYTLIRGILNRIGKERMKNNKLRFKVVSEVFSAFKEVKVGLLEKNYIKRFIDPAKNLAKNDASAKVLGQLPHFALEAIAFGGMMILILFLMTQTGTLISILPLIALYAFAGYRLIPAIQSIYIGVAQLRFVGPALNALSNDLKSLKMLNIVDQGTLKFNNHVSLNKIQYKYPNSSKLTINNISLNISANSTVGIVGPTGSGKTTIVDIILGLLEPTQGSLEVDGKKIDKENYRAWQRNVGYVPQQIFLADDTIASNIALGVDPEKINQEFVVNAAKIANLDDFIKTELPNKYQTKIGEHGIRLSGGQRQRIGIARALYNKPELLILDEGTSALDNLTEKDVMDTLSNLKKNITIILIAHRLNSVKQCDNIFLLENGELKEQGTFDELMKTNIKFIKMVKANKL